MTTKSVAAASIIVVLLYSVACTPTRPATTAPAVAPDATAGASTTLLDSDEAVYLTAEGSADGEAAPVTSEVWPGTGDFIDTRAARRTRNGSGEGDVVLNFQNSDLQEVVDTVLGEILGVNYMVDPNVSGSVSLATSQPITREAVIPTLETVLRLNGAVLTVADGIYMVLPQNQALARAPKPQLSPGAGGYQVMVVPLRYVAAAQIEPILTSLLPESSILLSDAVRNLLMIAGTSSELQHARDTVAIFDVDQMQGMSMGLFSLQQAEASTVAAELDSILGGEAGGGIAALVRLVTIDRLNAIIVVTPQIDYLEQVRGWIEKLDHTDDVAGLGMYVYPVQNGRAEHLAQLLSELFAPSRDDRGAASGSGPLAPSPTRPVSNAPGAARGAAGTASVGTAADGMRIIADEQNNSLVIMASRAGYAQVQAAVRKLDVLPLQVLVEATIVEVSLTDELSYGLQWFFKNSFDNKNGIGELFPLTVDPSFSYSVSGSSGEIRAVLSLLAADSRLDVISSPSLMVLDNRTATIKVGDQVPVRTSETTSLATSGSDALVTSTIQYRDTGVLLEVTPRVNQGGMVSLEITQDVNDVDQTTTSEIDSPTIIQRRITTNVAVQSGETVVLGGLIRENKSESEAGVPGLRNIPGIGRLFGSRVTNDTRTELLVLITPTAITTMSDARDATREMKDKMSGIDFEELD